MSAIKNMPTIFRSFALLAAFSFLTIMLVPLSVADESARERYREAVKLVKKGQTTEAQDILYQLKDYPLHSYLEAEILLAQLDKVSPQTVAMFLDENRDGVVGNRVGRRWLQHLARTGDWQDFLEHYRPEIATTTLRCQRLTALRRTGRDEMAVEETGKLWPTAYSLPRECDDALRRWLKAHPDPAAALWNRAELAMEAGNDSLVRYLLGKVPVASTVSEMLYRPALLSSRWDALPVDSRHQRVAVYLLTRLAAIDYKRADAAWSPLDERFEFSAGENFAIRQAIARPMIAANDPQVRPWLERINADGSDEYLLEWQIRLSLRESDWPQVAATIQRLSPELRREPVWRYWLSRAELALNDTPPDGAMQRLAELATERHYYGFLAANYLQQPYRLNGRQQRYPELIGALEQQPGVQRARELYALGELHWAHMEWRQALDGLDAREITTLAELARQWGWTHQAIMTAIKGGAWDDLDLRFPMAFSETFEQTADREKLDLHWLYAIARQESAFSEKAVSPAGAMGIMQIMPGTARKIARQTGRRYDREQMFEAQHSIPMGASYLGELLDTFNGNRILATAAYNVGPGAVQRVLARQLQEYPFDIWIETLPYSETRNYVKGVLSFAIVYSERSGQQIPLVAESELRISPTVTFALSERSAADAEQAID